MSDEKTFSSRWALMFAMLSMAVGTGNIWRFPRILWKNDGGTFLVPWIVFLVAWSIPLIIVEFALGRGTRSGPLGAIVKLNGRRSAWMGAWITATAVLIMFYYSVVTGWVLRYFLASLTGELAGANSQQFWDGFVAGKLPLALHVVSMFLALVVVRYGVRAIQHVTSLLLPTLVLLIFVLAVRAVTLDNASAGLKFMFTVDWQQLGNYRIWLEALTQNAWDTGAGWGLITAYAVYMRPKDDGSVNCALLGIGNNLVSLLAGIAVMCTIFSLMPEGRETILKQSSEGLTFVWIPQLFAKMPGGAFFMVLFFAALFLAAWTSLISMVELAIRGLEDLGITRNRALVLVGGVGIVCGAPSALSLNFFHNQDWVWSTALVVSGLLFSVALLKFGVDRFRQRYVNLDHHQIAIGRWWCVVVGVLVPLQAVALLAWFLLGTLPREGSWSARLAEWLQPFALENTGTALLQWSVLIAVLLAANRWLGRRAEEVAARSPRDAQ